MIVAGRVVAIQLQPAVCEIVFVDGHAAIKHIFFPINFHVFGFVPPLQQMQRAPAVEQR